MYTFASQTLTIINVILVNRFALTADFVEIIIIIGGWWGNYSVIKSCC